MSKTSKLLFIVGILFMILSYNCIVFAETSTTSLSTNQTTSNTTATTKTSSTNTKATTTKSTSDGLLQRFSSLTKGRPFTEIKTAGAMPLWLTKLLCECKIYRTSFYKYGTAYKQMAAGAILTGKMTCEKTLPTA